MKTFQIALMFLVFFLVGYVGLSFHVVTPVFTTLPSAKISPDSSFLTAATNVIDAIINMVSAYFQFMIFPLTSTDTPALISAVIAAFANLYFGTVAWMMLRGNS